jgi:phosphonoacetate hydrolase
VDDLDSARPIVTVNDRDYEWPRAPLVVVCLDGSSIDYIREAIAAGETPYLASLIEAGGLRMVDAAMPTFTNPNNVSIVTGVAAARHGISGNFFLDRDTGTAVMMNDASFLRAETILAAFSKRGARVAAITAKDKLRMLVGCGLDGICQSAERDGVAVYSAALSEHVLARGVALVESARPDLTYLSTSDYIQHTSAPGHPEANRFFGAVDRHLASLDRLGVTLVVTADHGMSAKTDSSGRPRIIFLQTLLDGWFGAGHARVILPITDPYVAHHGALGSFATVYLARGGSVEVVIARVRGVPGVEVVLDRDTACTRFDLPRDRTGDVVVCTDEATVVGSRPEDHDLSQLGAPLRSHGGLAERKVPMFFNRPFRPVAADPGKNYDAFAVGLNALSSTNLGSDRGQTPT